MAAFLTRALGLIASGSVDFVDDDGSIFESDIERIAEAGITKGCNPPVNDRFCPDDLVTRGQMAAFLARTLDLLMAPPPPETIFAVAYTDINTADGGYNPAVDVLIAKWVDDNGSGVADAGDKIITDQYPRDFGFSSFGTFGVTEHTVTGVLPTAGEQCGAEIGDPARVISFYSSSFGDLLEHFAEGDINAENSLWQDSTGEGISGPDNMDTLDVMTASPSQPQDTFLSTRLDDFADDPFLDIELDCFAS
jgi:hypothetical protein